MRDPEVGQLDSPWPTYGGSANYTRGLSVTVWPLHMGEAPVNDDRKTNKTAKSRVGPVGGRKIFLKIHHKSSFTPIDMKFGGLLATLGTRPPTKFRAAAPPPSGVIKR
jgi:hypothetical protein